MRIERVYDIEMSLEEVEILSEVVDLSDYMRRFDAWRKEMRIILTLEEMDYVLGKLESYLYSEDSIKGSELYNSITNIFFELTE